MWRRKKAWARQRTPRTDRPRLGGRWCGAVFAVGDGSGLALALPPCRETGPGRALLWSGVRGGAVPSEAKSLHKLKTWNRRTPTQNNHEGGPKRWRMVMSGWGNLWVEIHGAGPGGFRGVPGLDRAKMMPSSSSSRCWLWSRIPMPVRLPPPPTIETPRLGCPAICSRNLGSRIVAAKCDPHRMSVCERCTGAPLSSHNYPPTRERGPF